MMPIIELIISGLTIGFYYAFISYGLTLIYGTMKLVNVAHASFFMLGAYFCFFLYKAFGADPIFSWPLSFTFFFLIGMGIYRVFVNRIIGKVVSSLLLLFGLSLCLENIALLTFTGDERSILTPYTFSIIKFGYVSFAYTRIIVATLALFAFTFLYFLMNKSRFGKSIRAVIQDREAASLVGIKIERLCMVSFGIGLAFSATAGSISTLIYSFNPSFGKNLMLKAFTIIILGGMESIAGTLFAGVLLGLIESLSVLIIKSALVDVINYIILLLILLIKPTGLFGKPRI
jgi:branched-chain amino acid transport system permease protein